MSSEGLAANTDDHARACRESDDGRPVDGMGIASTVIDPGRDHDEGGDVDAVESRLLGLEQRLEGLRELPEALARLQDLPQQLALLQAMPQQLSAITETLGQLLQLRTPASTDAVPTPGVGSGTLLLEPASPRMEPTPPFRSVCERQPPHRHPARKGTAASHASTGTASQASGTTPLIGTPVGTVNLELYLKKRRPSVCSHASSIVSGASHSQALARSNIRASSSMSNATVQRETSREDFAAPRLRAITDLSSGVAEEGTAELSLPPCTRVPSDKGYECSPTGGVTPNSQDDPWSQPGTVPKERKVSNASFLSGAFFATRSGPDLKRQMTLLSLGGSCEEKLSQPSALELRLMEQPPLPCCIFLPNAPARLAWDLFLASAITLVCLLVPTGLVYTGVSSLRSGRLAHSMLALDVVWVLDIVINFRTAVVAGGNRIDDPVRIALAYLRRWFVWDLLSAFPVTFVPIWPHAIASFLLGLKLLRVLRLPGLFARVQLELRLAFLQPIKVMLLLALLSHSVSCSWRLVQRSDSGSIGESGDGLGDSGFLWLELYVQDVYWVLMTLTTVGYGDIVPQGFYGRLFAILAMLVAPLFTGVVVSALTHVTKGFFDDQIENRVAEVTRFMGRRRLPAPIQRRVQHNLRHHLRTEHQQSMDPELFALLSPSMQRELSLALLSSTVLRFPLFRGTKRAFVAELAQAHTWVRCLPGDLVVEEGQLVEEVVFVINGRLRMLFAAQSSSADSDADEEHSSCGAAEEREEIVVQTGAWFGEACLFEEGRVRTATITAISDAELAVLPAVEYHRIIQKYPKLLEKHQSIERALNDEVLSMEELAYKIPKPALRKMTWQRTSWPQFMQVSSMSSRSVAPEELSVGFSDFRVA